MAVLAPTAPLAAALAACREAAGLSSSVMVLFSGGKDSLAVLDLCVRTFARTEAVFMYLVPGLRFLEEPMERVCARMGVPLHKVPHWDSARLMKHAVLRFHSASAPTAQLKLGDVEAALRTRTGVTWVASGWKGTDGMQRRLVLRQVGAVNVKAHRLYPLATWRDRDVYAYLRARKLGVPEQVDKETKGTSRAKATGLSLEPVALSWLLRHHPDDYARVVEVFPFADARRWAYDHGHAQNNPANTATAAPRGGTASRRQASVPHQVPSVHHDADGTGEPESGPLQPAGD